VRTIGAGAAVVLLAGAALGETEWERKLGAFRAQTAAERKKLGLKNDAKYPTPEVAFATADTGATTNGTVVLCPGEKVEVKLKTNLPTGSLFLATTDEVTIIDEKLAGSSWSATLVARPAALPRPFDIRGVRAASGQEARLGRFLLGCKHTLVADADDAKLTAKLDFTSGRRSIEVDAEWTKAGKQQGTARYTATLDLSSLRLSRQAAEQDQKTLVDAATKSMNSPERTALSARLDKATKKMEPCFKVAPDAMNACVAPVQAEIKTINAEMAKLNDAMDVAGAPTFGCGELSLEFTQKGLTGTASRCPARKSTEQLPATGVITTP
jgi:hypothetical protein